MEIFMVKSEEQPGRRRMSMVNDEVQVARCVKRRRRETAAADQTSAVPTTVKRSSRFRGVSKHRWTGRFEAHLWDKLSWNLTQRKKGKQVYLGAFDEEESAARAYDLAALKYWGTSTFTNFPISDYEKEIEIMHTVTKEEYLASLRRKSSGFSRGVSKYRGVARHHHNGRWEARIGRVFGNKYLYLGTYSTQEEAAHAYDIAAIEYRGINAMTNFDLSTYIRWLKPGPNIAITAQPETKTEFQTAHPSSFDFGEESKPFLLQNKASEIKFPVSSCKKPSSPTALGLLLRSSLFRELVEKNSNVSEEENEGEEAKYQQWMGSEYEFAGILNGGNFNIPFVFSSDSTDNELQEEFNFAYHQANLLGTML